MAGWIKNFVWVWVFLLVAYNAGCGPGVPPISDTTTSSSSSSGTGGDDLGPCGLDCTKLETSQCTTAVCNTGQVVGPLNTCIVVPLPQGTGCDDGLFCTAGEACDGDGTCVGGEEYDCGLGGSPCVSVVCYEQSKTCDVTPVNDGAECVPTDLCEVNGVCELGKCIGEPKDCSFSPLNECNKVGCDPDTGKCVGLADPQKNDAPCVLTGDVCSTNKTCKDGQCGGGTPKDCSALDAGCQQGMCDTMSGICVAVNAPVGTICTEGLNECDVGACDVKGLCVASSAPDGALCNDHNACTKDDECLTGLCGGAAVVGCSLYLNEGFETCPNGWTLGGDWECGTPENVGPTEAHTGSGVIATQIAGLYHVSQSYSTAVADSPPIDLTTAVSPKLAFWAWDHTEGGSFDGWNLKISTNGGQTFTQVTTVTPPYSLTIASQQAWGGNHSADGWQYYGADLAAYTGKTVILRFSFRSDGATVFPGVYIDDLVVAEPLQNPLFITMDGSLPDVYAGQAYSTQIVKVGGTGGSEWSLKPGGVNDSWLTIDPATGALGGTPTLANVGNVSVTVRVAEPTLPSNYVEKTFTFTVKQAAFYTSFEGACPAGWTLAGDWECGAPSVVGPATAYAGSQCIGTQIDAAYNDLQTWAGTIATSPDIDLAGFIDPNLTFRMWVDTEGSTYDGFHILVSNDGGMTYTVLDGVSPAYPLMIGGKPAWGGHQAALGWQAVQASLSMYAGETIRLRFAFQSDSSGTFPGVYIDDILIN